MKLRLALLALPLLVLAAPVVAEPGLPDDGAVATALEAHPSVVAARARVEVARADARARAKGPHEITFSGSYVRRSVDLEGDYDEFDTQLTRAFRLPGKARLDREIGDAGVAEAENLAEDARHQAALLLMEHWFDWLGAATEARVDAQAVANYESALAAVRRRAELGDAAQLEVDQTAAALGAARVAAEQSAGMVRNARGRVAAHFPALAVPEDAPDLPAPVLPAEGLATLRERVIGNSHEIAAMDARAHKAQGMADRTRQDRIADPSIGLRLFSERNGDERGAGLVFSMPLGGGHRSALADQAAAEASAALAEAQLARFEVRETADSDVSEAEYRFAAWQRSREALHAQMAALTKLRRGHQLGEIDLADLLLAERSVHEALRAEAGTRTAANRAIARIRIDSHQLWLAD